MRGHCPFSDYSSWRYVSCGYGINKYHPSVGCCWPENNVMRWPVNVMMFLSPNVPVKCYKNLNDNPGVLREKYLPSPMSTIARRAPITLLTNTLDTISKYHVAMARHPIRLSQSRNPSAHDPAGSCGHGRGMVGADAGGGMPLYRR